MNTKTDTKAKADRSKPYVAAEDTIIEGRPVRKGIEVKTKDMTDDAFQSYVDAGLIETPDTDKVDEKANKVLEDAAKAIDTTKDKRTEK